MTKSLVYATAKEHQERTGHNAFEREWELDCDICILLQEAKVEAEKLEDVIDSVSRDFDDRGLVL